MAFCARLACDPTKDLLWPLRFACLLITIGAVLAGKDLIFKVASGGT
jgi:hypothetical protein